MPTDLFGEIETNHLTMEETAELAKVSIATIRNWVKTGYLVQHTKGWITRESLDGFIANVAGREKLSTRANKQFKDSGQQVTTEVALLFDQYNANEIGGVYEQTLSEAHRNQEGIYYTPPEVVNNMLSRVDVRPEHTFLDPCCGSGNFIIEALRKGVSLENVYGFDSDPNAVAITKERIRSEFGVDSPNIITGNFLDNALKMKREGINFDLIFTNPPWGKKLNKIDKERYAFLLGSGNSLDTSALFLNASISVLQTGGFLGFLVQEAFFNIAVFEDARRKLLTKKILNFTDYGRAFEGLLTKAQAVVIQNQPPESTHQITCRTGEINFTRSTHSFKQNPKTIFNFWTNEAESAIINRLYSVNHTTLAGKAKWALGIVTGNNGRFCSSEQLDGFLPVYKGTDITKSGLKEPSTYIQSDFSSFQQVAPIAMYQAKEKLIYKFISSDLCFFCDDQQTFILNSANLLIPDGLDISAKQLSDLLNSEIINWLFQQLFNTHKVLRGDLERLPIHTEYFKQYTHYSEETYLAYLQIKKTENGTFRLEK